MQSLQPLHPPASCSLDTSWSCCSGSWIPMAIGEPSSVTAFCPLGSHPWPPVTLVACPQSRLLDAVGGVPSCGTQPWVLHIGCMYCPHQLAHLCEPLPGFAWQFWHLHYMWPPPIPQPKELAWWSHPCPSVPKSMTHPSSKVCTLSFSLLQSACLNFC